MMLLPLPPIFQFSRQKNNTKLGYIVTLILYCRIYSFHYSEIIEKNLIIKKVVIFQPCPKKPL